MKDTVNSDIIVQGEHSNPVRTLMHSLMICQLFLHLSNPRQTIYIIIPARNLIG